MKIYHIFAGIVVLFLLFFPWKPLMAQADGAKRVVVSHTISLEDRHPVAAANEVYKDNILLTLSYLSGQSKRGEPLNWTAIRSANTFSWTLDPGKTFAFHDGILPQFAGHIAETTNAHFDGTEGFKSDGYLMGNGVCHLASLMDWVAQDAHLGVKAPTNHDFAVIPGISREHGVAIYNEAQNHEAGANQNLYVTNNTGNPVTLTFTHDGRSLTFAASVTE